LFRPGLLTEQWDVLIGVLWECGTAGVVEEDAGMRAFFEDAGTAAQLSTTYRDWIVEIRDEAAAVSCIPGKDCDPILIGKRFFVVPPVSEHVTPPGRIRLALDATTAFGTGRHESTQLVMEALEAHLPDRAVVLDVGCGSGILSLAARALGARRVFSCDVHGDAIATAAAYLDGLPLFRGTIDAVRNHAADLVIANISARVIDTLASDLNRITRPGGTLLLAGFIRERVPALFAPELVFEKNGWLCWVCRPRAGESAAEEQQSRIRSFTETWW
jgi:ribosomal protein L11 methylase PrmA